MTTPIIDFVEKYSSKNPERFHMPGHKGVGFLGYEKYDITEINGADSLFEANGIIKESESNASTLFGCDTFYSTEGSSLCIRTMLCLALRGIENPVVIAGRNAHKAFISAAALLDFDIIWISSNDNYLSCFVSAEDIETAIKTSSTKPSAVYITCPDYLGNMVDIKAISKVCKKYGLYLLVDNAHGAYLKFLNPSLHPMDLGADMCCDSAHKTLPCLTGGAYLHVSKETKKEFSVFVKETMCLFASTSPSYLILQSLDLVNKYIYDEYPEKLHECEEKVKELKRSLIDNGFVLFGNEPLKITIFAKKYGYSGMTLSHILEDKNVFSEYADEDFVVFMITPSSGDLNNLKKALLSVEKKKEISVSYPKTVIHQKIMTVRKAQLSNKECVSVEKAIGRILASPSVGCPPAVPIAVCGELITENTVSIFKYYGISECYVVK